MMKLEAGVTLIELMVTIAIAVILMAIVAPNFQTMLVKNRVAGITNEFMGTLNFARSEAIKRGISVSICPSNNASTCAGGWTDGWIVFVDNDGDGIRDTAGVVDELVRVNQRLGGNYTAATDNFGSAVTYARNGTANATGIFVFCGNSMEDLAQGIVVTLTRPRMASDSDDDGIPDKENSDGTLTEINSCEAP